MRLGLLLFSISLLHGQNPVILTGGGGSGSSTTVYSDICNIALFNPAADGSTDDSAVFTTAAATCSTIELTANKAYAIGTNLTLTAGIISISPPSGGPFVIKTGVTLALNGTITAPLKTLFTYQGTGVVTIGLNTPLVYTEWWGALGDGSNDDRTAINAALTSIVGGGTVQLLAKTYKITGALSVVNNGTIFQGMIYWQAGATQTTGTIISNTATTGDTISIAGTVTTCLAGSINNTTIRNMRLNRPTPATAGNGINTTNACWIWIENISSFDSFNHFKLVSARSGYWTHVYTTWTTSSASVRAGFDIDVTAGQSFTTYIRHALMGGTGSNTKGVYLHGTGNISDVIIDHLETAALDYGVHIIGQVGSLNANDIHITNAILDQCAVECVNITTVNDASDSIEISGGNFHSSAGLGLHLVNSRNVVVRGVHFSQANSVLLDTSAAYNSFVNNTFNPGSGKYGVKLTGTAAGNTFIGNVFNGTATATVLLSVLVSSQLNIFSGNIFGGTATTGLNFDNTAVNNIVYPNTILPAALTTPIANAGTGNDFGNMSSTPSVGTCGTIGTGSENQSGFITSGTTGSCVSVLTFNVSMAATGWSCGISNATTPNIITQTGSSTTTATFTGTTVTGDVLRYTCFPY